ncbi:thioesterase II family protein [Bradyrhizobium sp. USDA 4506]
MLGSGSWIQSVGRSGTPDMRLVCFPYAGGSSGAFKGWAAHLDNVEVLAVQLPGRSERIGEPACTRMDVVLQQLKSELAYSHSLPTVYYGHSMGAVIAFELALIVDASVRPTALVLSGRTAPSSERPRQMHDLPQHELFSSVRKFGGMPDAVFESADLMQMLETVLRADFKLLETWKESAGRRIDIPLLCAAGSADLVACVNDVGRWRQHAAADFQLRVFDGDHFFIQKSEIEFVRHLNRDLQYLRERRQREMKAGEQRHVAIQANHIYQGS